MLLHEVIHDEKVANNGGILNSFGSLITSVVPVRQRKYNSIMKMLEDQKYIKKIPWEVDRKIDLAYIAGFLDGDGSLMLQIKNRKDGISKIRFMSTICFYQDTRHENSLFWIQKVLGKGFFYQRNDGMSELRINGYESVREILKTLQPFIRFKKIQTKALIDACTILSSDRFKRLDREQKVKLVDLILVIQNENYVTKKKKTRDELLRILDLTP